MMVMEWIIRETVDHGEYGIKWQLTSKLDDQDTVNVIALLSTTKARGVGFKINIEKMKVMRINARNQKNISINEQDIIAVDFTYREQQFVGREVV